MRYESAAERINSAAYLCVVKTFLILQHFTKET